ncbi:MAG: hypothetical protein EOM64_10815, partial [Erysipelotrichia bacterium]|nr:hypothetical protein [Erysipelotrichia bacterium]
MKIQKLICAAMAAIVMGGCSAIRIADWFNLTEGDTIVIESTAGTVFHVEHNVPAHAFNTDFYYDQLSEKEQGTYDLIAAGCADFSSSISLNPVSLDAFYKAQAAFTYDHPEVFWLHSFTIQSMNDQVVGVSYTIQNDYRSIAADLQSMADQIIAGLPNGSSPYDRMKYFYDYIVDNTVYEDQEDEIDQDIRSVFLHHSSVCTGYTRAFQYLCDRAGIWCTMVSGTVSDGTGHSWNLVRINDHYYWVDVTWGDPVFSDAKVNMIDYNYLCVSDSQLLKTHVLDHGIRMSNYESDSVFAYPTCDDDSLNYFKLNGSWFDGYDAST